FFWELLFFFLSYVVPVCLFVCLFSVSMEELGMGPLDDLSLSEKTFPPQEAAGLRYPTLISGEINRDGVRTTGLLPLGIKRDVLLEKSNLLNPFNRVLAVRKQFRKRGGNSECFWKYCV
uniref:Urotensin-2-like n=1 Tax=Gouania willdenowi TaxID=441366 RepID=A0A8C5D6W9_GOUWI